MLQHPVGPGAVEGGAPFPHELAPAFVLEQGFPCRNERARAFGLEETAEEASRGATTSLSTLGESMLAQDREGVFAKERLKVIHSISCYLNGESEQCGHTSIGDV